MDLCQVMRTAPKQVFLFKLQHLASGRTLRFDRYNVCQLLYTTKPGQFGNNFQTITAHNLWLILQILDRVPAIFQDPDTRVENTIDSKEF
ncbi:hypothetical protein TNCV_698001 [Trichonephila clavipes]|nr:hypothetical protein TNCV_698001 [Trichonephila clavipes]